MTEHDTQTFFTPPEYSTQLSTINSAAYNLAHILLHRTESDYIFVPIRSMQYLAVIDGNDFWFIDSLAYAVRDNEGGRMITVSWHTETSNERVSLEQNVSLRVIFYAGDMQPIQRRLTGEFYQAMQQMDQRYRDRQIPAEGARIIAWKR